MMIIVVVLASSDSLNEMARRIEKGDVAMI